MSSRCAGAGACGAVAWRSEIVMSHLANAAYGQKHYRNAASDPGAYGLPPSAFEIAAMARCPRTLFPAASSGGDTTAMPNLPGDTAINPPPTPLLAGSPVVNSHLPESSYSPAVAMTARIPGTCSAEMTCLQVTGLRPPLASVAAITARSRAFTAIAHCRV